MEAVSIKGTREGLVILINPERELDEVKNNLISKMESSRGFFQGAKFAVHSKQPVPGYIFRELENICLLYGLVPSLDIEWPAPAGIKKSPGLKSKAQREHRSSNIIPFKQHEALPSEQCLLVNKTLRSGSRVESSHSVMVLGDINPGAQVASGGSILVLGACFGDVRAGQTNPGALIVAGRLKPTFLSIGPHMSDVSSLNCGTGGPWQVKLINGNLVFEKHSKDNGIY